MATREVTVRMFRKMLGDCFLLGFPRRGGGRFHMLIDCGALRSKHYKPADMNGIVRAIRKQTDSKLDVVAATHEHWDHISGFADARGEFEQIEVDKIWVAWTEDPKSEAAKVLKKQFKKGKKAVELALQRMPRHSDQRMAQYRTAVERLLEFSGGVGARDTTASTWQYILGKASNVYCHPEKPPLELDGVDDVRVYVLGPPEDPDYVRRLQSKRETYDSDHPTFAPFAGFLAATESDDAAAAERALPFARRHRLRPAPGARPDFFVKHYDADEWRRIDNEWLGLTGELALHLDSYTNNTCLAFAIELGDDGPVLLFPGDAQVGNWLSWQERKWTLRSKAGEKRTVTAAELLSRTVLYKVGHHGSHNATMRGKGLEMMESPGLVAMIPVHRKTAKDQEWEFPYRPLWRRLKERARGRVLLGDHDDLDEIDAELDKALSKAERTRFERATRFDPLFIEHRVAY
jgi:hypothetical protein